MTAILFQVAASPLSGRPVSKSMMVWWKEAKGWPFQLKNPATPGKAINGWLSIGWFLPNLNIGNAWKSPNIHPFLNGWKSLGFQVVQIPVFKTSCFPAPKIKETMRFCASTPGRSEASGVDLPKCNGIPRRPAMPPLAGREPWLWRIIAWLDFNIMEYLFLEPQGQPVENGWMEMVISNHFLCKDWESSNWNNHL